MRIHEISSIARNDDNGLCSIMGYARNVVDDTQVGQAFDRPNLHNSDPGWGGGTWPTNIRGGAAGNLKSYPVPESNS